MSASLVRKALDETTLAAGEKVDQLSKAAKKKLKLQKKKKKVPQDKLLKQNLRILKALEYKIPTAKTKPSSLPVATGQQIPTGKSKKKSKSKKKDTQQGSAFSEEDFEKFEKEYFVM